MSNQNSKPQAANKPNDNSVKALIFSIFFPPVGFIRSLRLLLRARKHPINVKRVWTATLIGAFLTVVFLYCTVIIVDNFAGNTLLPNPVRSDTEPFVQLMHQMGGRKISDSSFDGYGIDSHSPSYEVHFVVPDTPTLRQKILDVAEQNGFNLSPIGKCEGFNLPLDTKVLTVAIYYSNSKLQYLYSAPTSTAFCGGIPHNSSKDEADVQMQITIWR